MEVKAFSGKVRVTAGVAVCTFRCTELGVLQIFLPSHPVLDPLVAHGLHRSQPPVYLGSPVIMDCGCVQALIYLEVLEQVMRIVAGRVKYLKLRRYMLQSRTVQVGAEGTCYGRVWSRSEQKVHATVAYCPGRSRRYMLRSRTVQVGAEGTDCHTDEVRASAMFADVVPSRVATWAKSTN